MKTFRLALVVAVLYPTVVSGQTVQSIGTSAVQAADDYATRAFQDPWDMSQRTDLGAFLGSADAGSSNWASISFSSGVFTGVSDGSGDPVLWLLDSGNPNAAPLGKIGTNYPIDTGTYRILAFRMNVQRSSQVFVFSSANSIYEGAGTELTAVSSATTPGFGVYLMNLGASGTWSGLRRSLRFDPTGLASEQVQLDWARLVNVDATLCRTITWSGAGSSVNIYLLDANNGNANLGPIALNVPSAGGGVSAGCSGAAANSYKFYAGALPAGTYKVAVVNAGGTPTAGNFSSTTWVVNDTPTLRFTSPSEEGSDDDFATTQLNNPWDMDALTDIDLLVNVNNPQITSLNLEAPDGTSLPNQRVFLGASAAVAPCPSGTGDPVVELLENNRRGSTKQIDADRYRLLTVEYGIPNKARDINCGSVARVVWRQKGNLGVGTVSDDIILTSRAGTNMLDKFTVDLKTLFVEQGTGAGGTNWVNGPGGGIDIFRLDPHEYSSATSFFIKRVKLASYEQAKTTYTIRWTFSEGAGTVDLYYTTIPNDFASGTLINPSPINATLGQYTWNIPAGLATNPATPYYVYAKFSDGTNLNQVYGKIPLMLDSTFVPRPRIVLSRSTLNFGVTGGTLTSAPQTFRLSFVGAGASPCWTIANSLPGTFSVSPATGTGNATVTVSMVPQTFPGGGTGQTTLTINECVPNTILNPGQQLTATYRIASSPAPPVGAVDTPSEGVTVSGSVAVTGWVVDDVDIAVVSVYRDPVAGEPAGRVFIGNAVRVDDARPDIATAFPVTPFNYRGGWGYLLLSNFLPGEGNGTYVLRVYATDRDGHEALLGSRTIIGANSASTEPFGAIDTPGQGETIDGTSYANFGWVLARAPVRADPPSGGAVSVVVDGLIIGSPFGWVARPDLQAMFPAATYPGVNNALGVFNLDTTVYADGVHTIAWLVVANNSQAAGIGSRYFNIVNDGSLTPEPALAANVVTARPSVDPLPNLGRDAREIAAVDHAVAVRASHGYTMRRASMEIAPDPMGVRTIYGRSLGRVVVDASMPSAHQYEAYLVADGKLRSLPIGASFDQQQGVLYWQPGVAFTGAYDFVIVRDGRTRVPLRIVLTPDTYRPAPSRFVRGLFVLSN